MQITKLTKKIFLDKIQPVAKRGRLNLDFRAWGKKTVFLTAFFCGLFLFSNFAFAFSTTLPGEIGLNSTGNYSVTITENDINTLLNGTGYTTANVQYIVMFTSCSSNIENNMSAGWSKEYDCGSVGGCSFPVDINFSLPVPANEEAYCNNFLTPLTPNQIGFNVYDGSYSDLGTNISWQYVFNVIPATMATGANADLIRTGNAVINSTVDITLYTFQYYWWLFLVAIVISGLLALMYQYVKKITK